MISVAPVSPEDQTGVSLSRSIDGYDASILGSIWRNDISIAVWKRQLDAGLQSAISRMLEYRSILPVEAVVSVKNPFPEVSAVFDGSRVMPLIEDITQLVDGFCSVLDLPKARFHLSALNHVMCPRFHVDRVVCRLVTTYRGVATEWLPDYAVDRTKLGPVSAGKTDAQSGVYSSAMDIRRLDQGDVALIKGSLWSGSEVAGQVHRSPQVAYGEQRLLLTVDFSLD